MATATPAVAMWRVAELGAPGEDIGMLAVELADRLVVVSSDEAGLLAWANAGDGWVEAEAAGGTASQMSSVAAAAAVAGGVLVVLNDYETFIPQLWFSEDGLS